MRHLPALRLWLVAFSLLFSQWIFASHDHEVEHAVDENCQVCLLADHTDLAEQCDFTQQASGIVDRPVLELQSSFVSSFRSPYTARSPPASPHF